jgi:GT2 family glycosyltransferase
MRPSVTVVIPVWNGWDVTAGCLATLRPTLGPADDVVVVDNGSEDATGAMLAAHKWLRVISNATNQGFARACNQGGTAATGDVVVFLNNDTVLAPGWLDRLCAVFTDPGVGAAGPRSNFVSGPQMVHAASYDPASYPAWVEAWAADNRGRVEDVHRLVGFCLAVRRSAFDAVNGFDEGFGLGSFEDDDLCCRLAERGWRLVIAHEAFVHHIGHQTFDANGVDWRALESANGLRFLEKRRVAAGTVTALVDAAEAPVALLEDCVGRLIGQFDEVLVYGASPTAGSGAAALGARVVDSADDAVAAANGAWTLWVSTADAVEGDLDAVRTILASRPLPACVRVPVHELRGGATAWREGLTHYEGRLTRRGHRPSGQQAPALCELAVVHADGALSTPATDAEHALDQAASVVGLGWPEFALPYLEAAAEDAALRAGEWWRNVAMDVVLAGAAEPAAEVFDRVAPEDAVLRAMAATRAGDPAIALVLLAGGDDDPVVVVERWRAHDASGSAPTLPTLSDDALVRAVEHGCRDDAAVAARLLEALWARHPGADAVLAGGSRLRLTAGLETALVWAHRLRAHGLPAACPLLQGAADPGVAATDRVKAAAVAWAAFGEEVSRQLADRAWAEFGSGDDAAARAFVAAVAPALLPAGAAAVAS